MAEPAFSQSTADEVYRLPPEPSGWPIWPWLLLFLLPLAALWRWGGAARFVSDEPNGEQHPAVGIRLTRLHLEPLTGDGAAVSADDLTGKVTVLNFWGTWCGPCAIEFPHMVELEKHFHDRGDFQFFSISSNPDPFDERGLAENTAQFLRQQKALFPTYRDPGAETALALLRAAKIENFGFPTTVVLDRAAAIRGIWIGYRSGDEGEVRQAIEAALKS